MEIYTFKITEEIEVKFPHYRKYEHFYYKVLSPNREIKVSYIPEGACQYANISFDTIATGNDLKNKYTSLTKVEQAFQEVIELKDKLKATLK